MRLHRRPAALAAVVIVGLAFPAGAAAPVAAAAAVARAAVPALPGQLLTLLGRMERLSVQSERYSETVTVRVHHRHLARSASEIGLVGVSPPESELFTAGHSQPHLITIAGAQYEYSPEQCYPGRPWARSKVPAAAGGIYPFGPTPEGRRAGAQGPFGGLFELIDTARSVVEVGPVVLAGQRTTEFVITRETAAGTLGPRRAAGASAARRRVKQRLEVFFTGAGLPMRILETTQLGSTTATASYLVLALNLPLPLSIVAPPTAQTRPASNFSRTCSQHRKGAG